MTPFLRAWQRRGLAITALTSACLAGFLVAQYVFRSASAGQLLLHIALVAGGTPLVAELAIKLARGQFGSDLLAGISILTAVALRQYLAGTIVVLMLASGGALESFALRHASSVLQALAKRIPSGAHRRENGRTIDVPVAAIEPGDCLEIYPHEICPVDGEVVEGRSTMDESFLTGEPFQQPKIPGAAVISGSMNGDSALVIRAAKRAQDSRYAQIMEVMRQSEESRPRLRRLGDILGSWYTPLAIGVAGIAWIFSNDAVRFLAVLAVATPCPLLIAIPVTVVGAIALCARRSIVVKTSVALEQIGTCRTAIFDKTGTLTFGAPALTEITVLPGSSREAVLSLAAGVERYSRHPLASAIIAAAKDAGIAVADAMAVREPPGQGLHGTAGGHDVIITSRKHARAQKIAGAEALPPAGPGLECLVAVDRQIAAILRFRDAPRPEGGDFMRHLGPKHQFARTMIVSGDSETEVRWIADQMGIADIRAQQSPEEKRAIVQVETAQARTLYVGDGINDAPAMLAATVGIAFGRGSDITAQAADVVVLDQSLVKLDEFMHIGRRMRAIALQSAVGGMAISLAAMILAALGHLSPVEGAVGQEIIDLLAICNGLRAGFAPHLLQDTERAL